MAQYSAARIDALRRLLAAQQEPPPQVGQAATATRQPQPLPEMAAALQRLTPMPGQVTYRDAPHRNLLSHAAEQGAPAGFPARTPNPAQLPEGAVPPNPPRTLPGPPAPGTRPMHFDATDSADMTNVEDRRPPDATVPGPDPAALRALAEVLVRRLRGKAKGGA